MMDKRAPLFQSMGIVDVTMPKEDEHVHYFVQSMNEEQLFAYGTAMLETGRAYLIRFTFPVLDWVFEAQANVLSCKHAVPSDPNSSTNVHFELKEVDNKDQEKLKEYIEMKKTGQTEVKDILLGS